MHDFNKHLLWNWEKQKSIYYYNDILARKKDKFKGAVKKTCKNRPPELLADARFYASSFFACINIYVFETRKAWSRWLWKKKTLVLKDKYF